MHKYLVTVMSSAIGGCTRPNCITAITEEVSPEMARLTINHDTLERLRNEQPWGVFAEQLGIDGGTLSRIRNGESQPGPKFIANAVTRFPVRMDEIVTVIADDEPAAA